MEAIIAAILSGLILYFGQPSPETVLVSTSILVGLSIVGITLIKVFINTLQKNTKSTNFQKKIFSIIRKDSYLKELEYESIVMVMFFSLVLFYLSSPILSIYASIWGVLILIEYLSYFSLTYYTDLQIVVDNGYIEENEDD